MMKIIIALLFSISTLIGFAQVQMPDCEEIEYWLKEVELKFKNTALTNDNGIINSSKKMKGSGTTKFVIDTAMKLYVVHQSMYFENEKEAAAVTDSLATMLKTCTNKKGFEVDAATAMNDLMKGVQMSKYKIKMGSDIYNLFTVVNYFFDDSAEKWVMIIEVVRLDGETGAG
jgi:hypothetical protein